MGTRHGSTPANAADEHLMHGICHGDRNAFELLYERYFDKLVWFANGFLSDKEKAEDVVQEVFLKIIHKPELFDQQQKFSTWIYTLTSNSCRNALRNEQTRTSILQNTMLEEAEMVDLNLDQEFLQTRISGAVNQLSEKEKSLFTLRLEQELSIKEIAEVMQLPEGSVKSGIYYLLKKLAGSLKDLKYGN